ncbi:CDP-alcohol phosphatidyltransferase [Flavobacterium silvisoli]|uniref:CDP-alcohol phosphatidyltransferase n=1 Tax=Flavobacterium silvisoli TaxID=2529433 RepID=A0A4Q9YNU5_9FLAO|nr:CDP-alcohol phosphatidyltransferase [Flavobacterium silvisoli]
MNRLPLALIYLRLLIGFLLLFLSYCEVDNYRIIATVLFSVGLLSDVFDGIIARQLNVSTPKLRRLDSTVDQVFFIAFAIATFIQCPAFFENNRLQLSILFGFEVMAYLLCFLKFRKEIATHSIGAKIWTLFLFATLLEIIWQCQSDVLFAFCFWIGLATRLEIMVIILMIKNWTNDVPSAYHAWQLRQGRAIRRNKIFNG